MATYYVDYVSGSDSNNGTSSGTPVKTWNAANIGSGTFNPGDSLLFKSGVVYDGRAGRIAPVFSSTPTASTPFTVSTYGGTERAILDGGGTRDIGFRPNAAIDQANGPNYVRVENLEIRNYTSNGINFGEVTADGTHLNGSTIYNCYVHDIGGASEAAIKSWGTDVSIISCIVDNCAGDGIFVQGARQFISRNRITRVSNTGGGLGDGIQANAGSDNSVIEWNYIERENSDKQAIVWCGSNCLIQFNTIRGLSVGAGLLTLFSSTGNSANCVVRGNFLVGTDGIYLLDSTGAHQVYGNVIVGTNPNETIVNSTGIDFNGTNNHLIYNNTVVGHRRGIYCQGASARNNIVINCGGTGIDTGTGATVENYNCSYNNGSNFSGTPGANSVQIDPQLDTAYRPQNAALRSAGTFLGGMDFYGKTFPTAVDIGAVQFQPARTAVDRTTVDRSVVDRLVARRGMAA